jgi:hypothetical protein
MVRTRGALALRFDFRETAGHRRRPRLELVAGQVAGPAPSRVEGPEKYRLLDLKRRRAQIRARRLLGLLS